MFFMLLLLLSCFRHVRLCANLRSESCQDPLAMGFSRKEYWSGFPFPSQGILPPRGSHPGFLHCGQILYRLSHLGRPLFNVNALYFFFLLDSYGQKLSATWNRSCQRNPLVSHPALSIIGSGLCWCPSSGWGSALVLLFCWEYQPGKDPVFVS